MTLHSVVALLAVVVVIAILDLAYTLVTARRVRR